MRLLQQVSYGPQESILFKAEQNTSDCQNLTREVVTLLQEAKPAVQEGLTVLPGELTLSQDMALSTEKIGPNNLFRLFAVLS